MKNKLIIGIIGIILSLFVVFSGCINNTNDNYENNNGKIVELKIYCGAGMQQPMDEIKTEFEKKYPNIKINYDYGGSGALYSKIEMTNKGDLYLPGAYFYVEKLNKEGKILKYENITKHIPVIVVKRGNPKKINSLEDLGKNNIKVALGEENIAIGRASKKIFSNYIKINGEKGNTTVEKILNNTVVRGATVKQVLMYVELNNVDGAIVWRADALSSDKVDIIPINEKYNTIKTIPLSILKSTDHLTESELFYNYVLSEENGKKIFEKYGFVIL